MADWIVEEGIGEQRAYRLVDGRIEEARLAWPGGLQAGRVADAVLFRKPSRSGRGLARFADGSEALVDRLPLDAQKGAPIRLEVMRAAMAEAGRLKLAQARPIDKACADPSLAETLRAEGHVVRIARPYPDSDWNELVGEALTGEIAFDGGTLLLSATPAMTLIDIDGDIPPRALGIAACPTIADALERFDIGGSVGIDFPTPRAKADRRAVDEALAATLGDLPHERTAMNGFGFVQVVMRLSRPSILHLATHAPERMIAHQLLRRAEMLTGHGTILLSAPSIIADRLTPAMLDMLRRRTGRAVRVETDSGLAPGATSAQIVGA